MSRLVVVSGAASGIGRAAARWFADAGDELYLLGRRRAPLEALAAEVGGRAVPADLSTVDGASAVAAAVGPRAVDVIVAAAGGTPATNPVGLDEVAHDWNADVQQNLMTAVLLVEALKSRIARPGGRVIGLGSIGAQLGSGYGGSYGAAKAALHAWMYWLAQELGPQGVTANLVLPGYVPDTEFFGDRVTEEFDRVRVERSLVGRAGTAAEIAATIGFLASADAGYITGQLIGVNGGMVLGR
ncbi:SDR family oxidoreductase [Pseudolysinimonas kribbensis]|uniref:3-oxoacyl-ACP reductase n=1 Tax=Pseudolysinimonas kribbensis TaxID=433641 RepID=A0ABQ6K455_9MICO|nr:SDR family oxidoreductase [Pseudolysinimonas kribbensis]GMA95396.1 3-oxoacyl-ACP reductase [Pseudolysinimonas kribbensis]